MKNIINGNQELRPLLAQAQALLALQRHFMAVAPPHLAQSVQILSLQSGTLGIAAPNSAIAAKLRQLTPELVTLLQERGCEVSGIRVKVQVSYNLPQPRIVPHKLSRTAQDALQKLGSGLGDSPLKSALDRIAQAKKG